MRGLFAAFVAGLITACSISAPPAATPVSSPTPAVAASTSPAPTALTASPALRPTAAPITDPSQAFHAFVGGWRPSGPTVVIASSDAGGTTLTALPIGARGGGGPPMRIVSFATGQWDLRADGGAVAVAVWTGRGTRIAILDVRSGATRWLTPDEPGTSDFAPLWSKNGAHVYYGSSSDDGRTTTLLQIGADGTGKKSIAPAERFGGAVGLSPDGGGLVWSLGQAGGSVEILDLGTGVSRHIENTAQVASWRTRQPRLLLKVGGCCAGGPGGSLVAWDDVAMTSRVVAGIGQYGDPAWGTGAWDPTGTRIAAARYDGGSPSDATLVFIDVDGGMSQPAAAPRGIGYINWIPEGILFTVRQARQPGEELLLLPSPTATAISLFTEQNAISRIDVVRP